MQAKGPCEKIGIVQHCQGGGEGMKRKGVEGISWICEWIKPHTVAA